jgi:hypothetical protein
MASARGAFRSSTVDRCLEPIGRKAHHQLAVDIDRRHRPLGVEALCPLPGSLVAVDVVVDKSDMVLAHVVAGFSAAGAPRALAGVGARSRGLDGKGTAGEAVGCTSVALASRYAKTPDATMPTVSNQVRSLAAN